MGECTQIRLLRCLPDENYLWLLLTCLELAIDLPEQSEHLEVTLKEMNN